MLTRTFYERQDEVIMTKLEFDNLKINDIVISNNVLYKIIYIDSSDLYNHQYFRIYALTNISSDNLEIFDYRDRENFSIATDLDKVKFL